MRQTYTSIFFSIITISLALFIYALSNTDLYGSVKSSAFTLNTILLVVYLLLQIIQVRNLEPRKWLLNPVIVCSIVTFLLSYGISNILYIISPDSDLMKKIDVVPGITESMNKLMFMVIVGAVALWSGYWFNNNKIINTDALLVRLANHVFKRDPKPKTWIIYILFVLSLISRIFAIKLGLYGYATISYEYALDNANYSQYISYISSFGKFVLLVASIEYYSSKSLVFKNIMYISLIIEIIFGLLTGYKSNVIMPYIIVQIIRYFCTGVISIKSFIILPVLFTLAYGIIEPFRLDKNNAVGTVFSLTDIVDSMAKNANLSSESDKEKAPMLFNLFYRFNYTFVGAEGVSFADAYEELPVGSPDFLTDILVAPFYALIPRFLWEEKRIDDLGLWYTHEVLGVKHNTFTAMGPITHLYFAGGLVGVALGFFCIGILQRVFLTAIRPWFRADRSVVFFGMLGVLSVGEYQINSIVVSLFRDLPLLLIIVSVVYKEAFPVIRL